MNVRHARRAAHHHNALDLVGSKPGIAHSTRNTSLAGTVVFRAALFASRQVWRACSSHHNLTCLRDDLLPL
ncbi:MAG: hypothetical protein QMC09_16375, partial [Thauera sp.]